MKKIRAVCVVITFMLIFVSCAKLNNEKNEVTEDKIHIDNGIYILSALDKILYLSDDFEVISELSIKGGWDISYISEGKVYASSRNGSEIISLNNGNIQDEIKLTYNMPTIIRYNQYNKKAYIGHAGKLTYRNENCISVIDTLTNQEVDNIMYDEYVKDIVFSVDNKMIVSSDDLVETNRKLDVFDLENNSIIKTINLDVWISSMCLLPENNLIYAVSETLNEPRIYIIDWEKGNIDILELKYNYPNKVYINQIGEEKYIYVTHLNEDNREGQQITIIDPITNTIIDEITNANCPVDIDFMGEDILVGDWEDNKLHVIRDNKIQRSISVRRPTSIVNSNR